MFYSNVGEAVADTVKQTAGKSDSGWILHHVMDSNTIDFEPFGTLHLPHLQLLGLDISITKHIFFMWVVALLLMLVLYIGSRRYKKSLIPHGLSNLLEIVILFFRD